MKKLLSILAAVGLTATASSTVVACGTSKAEKDAESYTGNKKAVDQTVEVKDNSFEFKMNFTKDFIFNIKSDKNWELGGKGQFDDNKSTHAQVITLISTNFAIKGSDISNADKDSGIDAELTIDGSAIKDKCNISEDGAYATLKDNVKNISVNVKFESDTTIKDGDKYSLVLVNYDATGNDDAKMVIDSVLYNFTLKLAK